jgi:hypothetical protein
MVFLCYANILIIKRCRLMLDGVCDRLKKDPITGVSVRKTSILKSCVQGFNSLYNVVDTYDEQQLCNNHMSEEFYAMRDIIRHAVSGLRVSPFKRGGHYLRNPYSGSYQTLDEIKSKMIQRINTLSDSNEINSETLRLEMFDYAVRDIKGQLPTIGWNYNYYSI